MWLVSAVYSHLPRAKLYPRWNTLSVTPPPQLSSTPPPILLLFLLPTLLSFSSFSPFPFLLPAFLSPFLPSRLSNLFFSSSSFPLTCSRTLSLSFFFLLFLYLLRPCIPFTFLHLFLLHYLFLTCFHFLSFPSFFSLLSFIIFFWFSFSFLTSAYLTIPLFYSPFSSS